MDENKLREQFEEYCKLFDVIVPRWQRKLLANNIANRSEQHIIIPRNCGRSYLRYYYYFYKEWLKNKEKENDT